MNMKAIFVTITALLVTTPPLAENVHDLGSHVVHYNALSTTLLSKKVARTYGITRSRNRAILNIAVMKKRDGTTAVAVPARVTAHATNLNKQIKTLNVREIKEQSAIYYIAEFSISNGESLSFTVTVSADNQLPQTIRFDKQFFTD